jgi:zinc transport system permease protein
MGAPTLAGFVQDLPYAWPPIVCGAAAGALLGALGVYVVLRRMVFVSAAVSEAAGLGVVVALAAQTYLGVPAYLADPLLGAAAVAVLASRLFVADPVRLHLTRESVLGVVFVLAGAGTLLLGSRLPQESHDIQHILFGTAVMVRTTDLVAVVTVSVVLLGLHGWLRRGIAMATFDPDSAAVQGLPVRHLDAFLFLSIGVAVAVTTHAIGAMPVFALTVLPAVAALATSRRLVVATVTASVLGLFSGATGYVAAYLLALPVGACQTAVAGSLALAGLAVGSLRRDC